MQRKGICINHCRDIADFFKGAHLTINARTDEDVEPANVVGKLSKLSTTRLNLKERLDISENVSPVGSAYKVSRFIFYFIFLSVYLPAAKCRRL